MKNAAHRRHAKMVRKERQRRIDIKRAKFNKEYTRANIISTAIGAVLVFSIIRWG